MDSLLVGSAISKPLARPTVQMWRGYVVERMRRHCPIAHLMQIMAFTIYGSIHRAIWMQWHLKWGGT